MGIAKKTDGRYVVGMGVTDANDYKGSASYRDIYIQLTADGATEESVEYLTYLKDYATYHSELGEPIMPPSVNVWISNNGVTTAVEADDLALDGDNFTICGIVWDGSSWDYSNAGKGGGSSLPEYTASDEGKVLALVKPYTLIVNETVTFSGDAVLLEDPTPLLAYGGGDTLRLTIGDSVYEGVVVSSQGENLLESDGDPMFIDWGSGNGGYALVSYYQEGTFTVKVEAPSDNVEPTWNAPAVETLVVNITSSAEPSPNGSLVMDKTYSQITAALSAGVMPMFLELKGNNNILCYRLVGVRNLLDDIGEVMVILENPVGTENYPFGAQSVDGYPTCILEE